MSDPSIYERKYGTKCPRLGAHQWTCTYSECECHLKDELLRVPVTDPSHGGKVICGICRTMIYEDQKHYIQNGCDFTHVDCEIRTSYS